MKKKLVGLMLSGMLVLSLAACGGDDAAADSTNVSTQAEVSTCLLYTSTGQLPWGFLIWCRERW